MMLRGELLVALAELGHDITQNEASRRFSLFLDDRNTSLLPPDTRKVEYIDVNAYMLFDTYKLVDIIFYFVQAAYAAVMHTVTCTNKSGYENLLKIYRETDLSQEKTRILSMSDSLCIT